MDKEVQTYQVSDEEANATVSTERKPDTCSEHPALSAQSSAESTTEDFEDNEKEEQAVAHFYAQVSCVLSDASSKLRQLLRGVQELHIDSVIVRQNNNQEEAQKFNSDASSRMAVALSKMKLRHIEQEENLLRELRNARLFSCSLESSLERKDLQIKNLVKKLELQQNSLLLSKAFHKWRMVLAAEKRQTHLMAIASNHYEKTLKQRIFRYWKDLLKVSWRKRMELQANMEILEAQKQVVGLYESKIRNLEANLSEAGKKIDKLLQCNLKPREDYTRQGLLEKLQAQNYSAASYRPVSSEQRTSGLEKAYETSTSSLCEECSSQMYVSEQHSVYTPSASCYVVRQDAAVPQVIPHPKPYCPTSQPQSLPVMGTPGVRRLGFSNRSGSSTKSVERRPLIERHIPRDQVFPKAVSVPVVKSAKSNTHKKIV